MNEITVHGNLTANPVVHRNPNTPRSVTTFDVAVNSRYYDRERGSWIDRPPVFHHVACFGQLGANAAQSLSKGMTVTVTGSFADDSYTPNGADKPLRRIRLEAGDVAVSLRWAVADVERQTRAAEQATEQPGVGSNGAAVGTQLAGTADDTADDGGRPEADESPAAKTAGRRATRRQPEPVAA